MPEAILNPSYIYCIRFDNIGSLYFDTNLLEIHIGIYSYFFRTQITGHIYQIGFTVNVDHRAEDKS